jgi:hypothetical protein
MAYGNGGSYGESTASMNYPTANAMPAPPREPAILQEAGRLDKHVETLHMAISELEARIGVVLMPEPPSAQAKDGGRPIVPVPLAQTIAQQADRVSGACARLQALIARIEL